MKTLLSLALSSLISRKKTVFLTFISLTISILVLLSVEHIRVQAKDSFNRTISGVDLIVGAPSGQLNLLLYSVFRMGSPTQNIDYDSFKMLNEHKQVKWAIPISLGDSHKGFRVMGTNDAYFEHYRFGNKQNLSFAEGKPFNGLFEAVLGFEVAKTLGYKINDEIVIAHGLGNVSFNNHDQAPFVIKGVLSATGTPVDKTVHVSLGAIEAIHMSPASLQSLYESAEQTAPEPKNISAVLLGLNSKFATFGLQRNINNYQEDRLMAVLPGVAMAELWQLMGTVENLLRVIAALVLLSSLFGLSTMLLASMNERQPEIAVFRVLGAGPKTILLLILLEALLLVVFALISAMLFLLLSLFLLDGYLSSEFGLFLSIDIFTNEMATVSAFVLIATLIVSVFPGIEAYRNALHTQLASR